MATYEKENDDTVKIITTTTVSKKTLEKELAHLNQNIAHKTVLRDEIVKKLNVFN